MRYPEEHALSNSPFISRRLAFSGAGLDAGFLAFVADRAQRFSLDGWGELADGRAVVVVHGHPALIDMLEIACWLGPLESLVEAVSNEAEPSEAAGSAGDPRGFVVRIASPAASGSPLA